MLRKRKKPLFSLHFPEKEQIFTILDKHFIEWTPIILAVSGWSDSMLLATVVINYILEKWQELSTVTILHINHKTRPETDSEELFIYEHFTALKVVSFVYKWKKKTEKVLRDARLEFIRTHIWKLKKQAILMTWHNLTDRIETSLLHMSRGAGVDGIQNMKEAELIQASSKLQYLLVRPLLWLTKDRITEICKTNKIPFVQDMSNFDSTTSKRNKLRHEILPQLTSLGGKTSWNSFWQSRQLLYIFLDTYNQPLEPIFYNLSSSVYRWHTLEYIRFELPTSLYETSYLLKQLDSNQQASYSFLQIFYKFLTKWTKGRLFFDNHYFFVAHKKLYVVKHTKKFWEEEVKKERKVTKLGEYKTGDFIRNITDEKLIGGIIRFPRQGDQRKGKRVKKRLLNKKIPLFWRNYIPVIEQKGKIVAILPLEQVEGRY